MKMKTGMYVARCKCGEELVVSCDENLRLFWYNQEGSRVLCCPICAGWLAPDASTLVRMNGIRFAEVEFLNSKA